MLAVVGIVVFLVAVAVVVVDVVAVDGFVFVVLGCCCYC